MKELVGVCRARSVATLTHTSEFPASTAPMSSTPPTSAAAPGPASPAAAPAPGPRPASSPSGSAVLRFPMVRRPQAPGRALSTADSAGPQAGESLPSGTPRPDSGPAPTPPRLRGPPAALHRAPSICSGWNFAQGETGRRTNAVARRDGNDARWWPRAGPASPGAARGPHPEKPTRMEGQSDQALKRAGIDASAILPGPCVRPGPRAVHLVHLVSGKTSLPGPFRQTREDRSLSSTRLPGGLASTSRAPSTPPPPARDSAPDPTADAWLVPPLPSSLWSSARATTTVSRGPTHCTVGPPVAASEWAGTSPRPSTPGRTAERSTLLPPPVPLAQDPELGRCPSDPGQGVWGPDSRFSPGGGNEKDKTGLGRFQTCRRESACKVQQRQFYGLFIKSG